MSRSPILTDNVGRKIPIVLGCCIIIVGAVVPFDWRVNVPEKPSSWISSAVALIVTSSSVWDAVLEIAFRAEPVTNSYGGWP